MTDIPPRTADTPSEAPVVTDVHTHWNDHIVVDQWGNSVFKRDTPGCRFCDALSGRAARAGVRRG